MATKNDSTDASNAGAAQAEPASSTSAETSTASQGLDDKTTEPAVMTSLATMLFKASDRASPAYASALNVAGQRAAELKNVLADALKAADAESDADLHTGLEMLATLL